MKEASDNQMTVLRRAMLRSKLAFDIELTATATGHLLCKTFNTFLFEKEKIDPNHVNDAGSFLLIKKKG